MYHFLMTSVTIQAVGLSRLQRLKLFHCFLLTYTHGFLLIERFQDSAVRRLFEILKYFHSMFLYSYAD
jgi:hypothetical protein